MQWSGNTPARHCADRNFHGKKVSPDKRKALPTQTRSINSLFGDEINTALHSQDKEKLREELSWEDGE
jgi:hypothetical protein